MLAIIQSRMSSVRLPGKAMLEIAGKPLLANVYERVASSSIVTNIVVATSNHSSDDVIFNYCYSHGYNCFRGDLNNVASRFLSIAEVWNAREFIRINGDSPFIDPLVIDYGGKLYKDYDVEMVTNVQRRSFPKGQSVEIISFKAFELMMKQNLTHEELEHVTLFFYKNPKNIKILNFYLKKSLENKQLSIDTIEDFNFVTKNLLIEGFIPLYHDHDFAVS